MLRLTLRRRKLGVIPLSLIAGMLDVWFLTLVVSVALSNPVVTDPTLNTILDAVLEDWVALTESNRPLTGFQLPCTLYVHFPSGRTRRALLETRSTDKVNVRSFTSGCTYPEDRPIELVGEFESEALRLERVVWISSSEIGVWFQSRSPFHGVRKGVLRLAQSGDTWVVVERRTGDLMPWREVFHDRPIF